MALGYIQPVVVNGISEPSTVAVNCLGWSYNDSGLFCAGGVSVFFVCRVKSGLGFWPGNVEVAAPSQRVFAIFGMITRYPYCTHMTPFAIMFFDDWFIFCCAYSASCHHSLSLFVSMRSIEFNPFGSHLLAVLLLFKSRDTVSHVSCTKEDHPPGRNDGKRNIDGS